MLAVLIALLAGEPASAHRKGKAEPKIAAGVSAEPGLTRRMTVRLSDVDSKKPVKGATVVAFAEIDEAGGARTGGVRLSEGPPATYRGTLEFMHAGDWTVVIRVSGRKVIRASGRLGVTIRESAKTEAQGGKEQQPPHGADEEHLQELGTTIEEDDLARGDYARMASLWIHSLAAMGWIIGVLAMVLALSAHVGVVAENARTRIADAYRRWGAWVHWGFVPVIVGTGVYNMLYVTPFPLAYTPSDLDALREIPYGPLYEAVLIAKLSFFVILLVTGTLTLLRVIRTPAPVLAPANPHSPGAVRTLVSALGPAGLIYLATVPLILGAAMALRYIHVLSHVAEVLRAG